MERRTCSEKTILNLIEYQSIKSPNATAIVFDDQLISYIELAQRTDQLSNYLQSAEIAQGTIIGVYMNRSIEMIITLIGIMKSGCAYLPIDSANPVERNNYILESAKINFIITDSTLLNSASGFGVQLFCLDTQWNDINNTPAIKERRIITSSDTAYVLYTSGSTGLPKGVVISHAGIVNILQHIRKITNITSKDRFLAVATYTFDISVLDFFLPLISGATLIVGDKNTAFDAIKLKETLENNKITVMQATPATWRLLVDSGWKGNNNFIIYCGGEAWSRDLANQLLDKCKSLWNLYGPTETTIWSIINQILPGDNRITLGTVVPNTRIYILDENMKKVPHGEIGELYIGGVGVAKGYHNNPQLTNKNFIINPFQVDSKSLIYKTGDLVKYNEDGELEYIGRADFQVKIRGYRIELEEIEALAQKHPCINQAIAHVISGESQEDKRIVLFYTVSKQEVHLEQSLKDILEASLPQYMVPSAFKEIEDFPLSINGKIDRKTLELKYPISSMSLSTSYEEAQTEFEKKLSAIWSDLLEFDMIGINDNFLELGGHSLMANRLTARINQIFGTTLTLIDLLTNQMTIKMQALLIENNLISQLSNEEINELLAQLEGFTEQEKQAILMI
ncbi:MAG: non-ribosomal peptide synthetase [Oscillospiraceae bacterium]